MGLIHKLFPLCGKHRARLLLARSLLIVLVAIPLVYWLWWTIDLGSSYVAWVQVLRSVPKCKDGLMWSDENEQAKKVDASKPYLSVVVVSRNDHHGGDSLGRLANMIRNLGMNADRTSTFLELVIVEWYAAFVQFALS